MYAMYPDIIIKHIPAMPVAQIHDEPQPHRERESQEGPEDSACRAYVFESIDPLAAAARLDEEPADDEAEDHETRDETSLEHLTLHDRKRPYGEFCQPGGMLKRYCKRVRQVDEDDEKLIHRPTTFGDIIEADHMFPSEQAIGGSQMSNQRWW